MFDNQASRQDRGLQTAYEDRSYEIQQHIWRLQDEHERLLAASQRLYARLPAASQRLHASCEQNQHDLDQLIASIRSSTSQIRHFIAESVRAVEDWNVAIDQYRLREDTSSWAQVQLNHHAAFFADPSLAPPLDVQFRQLLQVYRNIQDEAEALIIQKTTRALDHVQPQASPSGSSAPSHNDGNGRLVGRATIWSGRPEPSHNDGNGHLTGDATLSSPSAAYVPKSPPPDSATATLYRPAPQLTPAHSQRDASTASRATMSRSAAAILPTTAQHTADKHHRLQQQFQSATHPMPAGGRGSETSASGPLRTGADGRPLKASTTRGTQGSAATLVDFEEAVIMCPLCNSNHRAENCTKYPTIYMRIWRATKLGLCSLCLKESHRSESCPLSATNCCPVCRQGHHGALCPAMEVDSPSEADRRRTMQTSPDRNQPAEQVSDTRHPLRVNPVRRGDSKGESTVSESAPPSALSSSTSNLTTIPERTWTEEERTTPKGRLGTIRPTTTTTHKSVSQQGANVLADGLLLDDHHLLPERRSPRIENVQFPEVKGTLECRGNRSPDRVPREGRLHAEKVSTPPVPRRRHHDTVVSLVTPDIDRDVIQFATQPAVHRPTHSSGDVASAESASFPTTIAEDPPACSPPPSREQAVILEGTRTTAWNPAGGHVREVTLVFRSASTTTCISPQLAEDMKLERRNTRPFKANTFGSSTPTAFEASTVTIVLGTDGREPLHLHATTAPRDFPPLRIAPIDREHLSALRNYSLAVPVIQEQPDILVGQDCAHLFERTILPRLPHGFAVIGTIMGPVLSGVGRVAAANIPKAVPSLSEPNEDLASPNDATIHRTGSKDVPFRPNDATLHPTGSKEVPARPNDAALRLTASSNVLARQNDATLHLTTPPVPLLQVSTPSTEPTAPPSLHTDGSDATTVSKPEPSHTDGKGREPSTTKAPAPPTPGDENADFGSKPAPSHNDGKGLHPLRTKINTRYELNGQVNRSGGPK
ncbi:Zinc knuckle family protein [Aphelenchoides avenae]|nr:Zinc knuckle family protein [Aphelenchus avenae]